MIKFTIDAKTGRQLAEPPRGGTVGSFSWSGLEEILEKAGVLLRSGESIVCYEVDTTGVTFTVKRK